MDTVYTEPQLEVSNLGRMAWGIMFISFALFCVLCISSSVAVYSFFFQSTMPMNAVAKNSRGILAYVGPDLSRQLLDGSKVISNGNIVSPADPASQGVINVTDPYVDELFIGSLTLKGSSTSTVFRHASRPRFEWSNANYQVEFADMIGDFDVLVGQHIDRDISFDLITRQGSRIKLTEPGQYAVSVTEGDVRVVNHSGQMILIPRDQTIGWDVPRGSGALSTVGQTGVEPIPTLTNIIQNNNFEEVLEPDNFPLVWACNDRNDQINAPRGRLIAGQQDGRYIVQMLRDGGAESNGEVFCQQGVQRGNVWYDLSGIDFLGFRTSFYINYHSLSLCGVQGSECPLMIQLDYINANGDPAQINYGFYIYFEPTMNDPNTCESCRQPHVFVKEKTWYTFESGNILQLFPENERPEAISSIRMYASGHEYDTRVSELSLLIDER